MNDGPLVAEIVERRDDGQERADINRTPHRRIDRCVVTGEIVLIEEADVPRRAGEIRGGTGDRQRDHDLTVIIGDLIRADGPA